MIYRSVLVIIALSVLTVPVRMYAAEAKVMTKAKQVPKIEKLYDRVKRRDLRLVLKSLKKGESPDVRIEENDGRTILMSAITFFCAEEAEFRDFYPCDCIPILAALIGKSADLNIQDKSGNTALSLAAESGKILRMQMLIDAGAQVNKRLTGSNDTALVRAVIKHKPKSVHYLLKAGADCDITTYIFATSTITLTPRAEVAKNNDYSVCITLLLNAGATVDHFCGRSVLLNDPDVQEALKHAKQRRRAYKDVVAKQLMGAIDSMILDVAKIIAEYAVSAAPARVLNDAEMQAIQPTLNSIALCKAINNFDTAYEEITDIYEQFEELKPSLNSLQITWIKDALDDFWIHAAHLMQLEDSSTCVVM